MKGHKPVSNPDPLILWERASKEFQKMSAKKQVQTLVKAGIITEKKNLREPYRRAFASVKVANG